MYSAGDVNQCGGSIFFLRVRMSVHGCNIKMRKIKNGERKRESGQNSRVVGSHFKYNEATEANRVWSTLYHFIVAASQRK